MNGVVTINVTITNTTLGTLAGLYSTGMTEQALSDLVTIEDGNILVFSEQFNKLYIQPESNKSVSIMIGGPNATVAEGFVVTDQGLDIAVKNNKLSLAATGAVVVSILAI